MPVFLHGLTIGDSDGANRLRFGLSRFLGNLWVDQGFRPPDERHVWPYSPLDRRFVHVAGASQNMVWKLDRTAALYRQAASAYGKAVVEGGPTGAHHDLGIHLDSMIVYLRVLADVVAAAAPYLYPSTPTTLPSRSLRDHIKWFTKKEPNFDAEYASAIGPHLEWFEALAGKGGRGIRDLLIHRFAHYQASVITAPPELQGQVTPGLITERGYAHDDVTELLRSVVDGLCHFLDAFVLHHCARLEASTGWMVIDLDKPHSSELYRFEQALPSHWLFPVRNDNATVRD